MTLSSIDRQSFRDFEIIALDDGSSDSSLQILQDSKMKRPIRIMHNSNAKGLVAARNELLDQARGEYVAWLDQDDLAAPNRLELQTNYLNRHSNVSLIGSSSIFFRVKSVQSHSLSVLKYQRYPTRSDAIKCRLPFENCFDCSTVTQRLSDVEGIRFSHEDGLALDYGLWLRLSREVNLVNLPQFLGAWRIHSSQNSRGVGGTEIAQMSLGLGVNALCEAFGEQIRPEALLSLKVIKLMKRNWNARDVTNAVKFLGMLSHLNETTPYFPKEPWRYEIKFQIARLLFLYGKKSPKLWNSSLFFQMLHADILQQSLLKIEQKYANSRELIEFISWYTQISNKPFSLQVE